MKPTPTPYQRSLYSEKQLKMVKATPRRVNFYSLNFKELNDQLSDLNDQLSP